MAIGLVVAAMLAGPALVNAPSPAAAEEGWETAEVASLGSRSFSLALEHGRPRVAYSADNDYRGRPYGVGYLWCDAQCSDEDAWHSLVVSDDTVRKVSLTIDAWGHNHLFFTGGWTLFYATCETDCETRESWSVVALDLDAPSEISSAVDMAGRPRVAYVTNANHQVHLRFGSCDSGCEDAANWTLMPLDTGAKPHHPDLVYEGTRPRLAYTAEGEHGRALVYATCEQHCLAPESWRHTHLGRTRSSDPDWDAIALATDGAGMHIVHFGERVIEGDGLLAEGESERERGPAYLRCTAACTKASNWDDLALVGNGSPKGLALVDGRPRILTQGSGQLSLWNCDTDCRQDESWRETVIGTETGWDHSRPSLALDGERPTVAFPELAEGPPTLYVARCGAPCGNAGSYGSPPSGPPPPSTSTHPPPSTTTSTVTSTTEVAEGGGTVSDLSGKRQIEDESMSVSVRERFRLRSPHPRVVPAEDGAEGDGRPPDGRTFPGVPLTDRGATVAAALAMLVFVSLGVLAYWRVTRPLVAWHRSGRVRRRRHEAF